MNRSQRSSGVYLLHFSEPYQHAQHYLGYSSQIIARLATHRAGRGVPLTQAACKAGIEIHLARRWPKGTKGLERLLRRQHANTRLCPICNPSAARYGKPERTRAHRAMYGPGPDCPF
jgi:hypothetical protein